VARHKVAGKAEVSKYLGIYGKLRDWLFVVDGRTAALVCDPANPRANRSISLYWTGASTD
jgi:hypothetical protein